MTSFGHACTFADYANIPVNSPSLLKIFHQCFLKKDGPLAVDFFYNKKIYLGHKFLKNCRKKKLKKLLLL